MEVSGLNAGPCPTKRLQLSGEVVKAKLAMEAARDALAKAQSEFIRAERLHQDALNAWEQEFFGK